VHSTQADLESLGRALCGFTTGVELYTRAQLSGPAWNQLGDVTRSVWEEKARRYNEGDPKWWSCQPQEKHEG
jgi:hypothetical protein